MNKNKVVINKNTPVNPRTSTNNDVRDLIAKFVNVKNFDGVELEKVKSVGGFQDSELTLELVLDTSTPFTAPTPVLRLNGYEIARRIPQGVEKGVPTIVSSFASDINFGGVSKGSFVFVKTILADELEKARQAVRNVRECLRIV